MNGFRKNDCVMECRGVEGGGGGSLKAGSKETFLSCVVFIVVRFFF